MRRGHLGRFLEGLCAVVALGVVESVREGLRARRQRRRAGAVLVAVSGTLQDGFPLRRNLDAAGVPAALVGWALVRGVKMYLDPKPAGCREHGGGACNPALVPTGDARDANVYAVYAVAEGAVLRALLGEPRCLGMTPDTALVDVEAEETSADLRALLREMGAADGKAALLTVVAHSVPRGAVAAEPMYVKPDGTRVTSFAPCVAAFAGERDVRGPADTPPPAPERLREAIARAQADAQPLPPALYGAAPETLRLARPVPFQVLRSTAARAVGRVPWF